MDQYGDATLVERVEAAFIAGRIDRRTFLRFSMAAGLSAHALAVRAQELEAIRANQDQRGQSLQPSYDYVVVGSGSAGCALVGRLSADPAVSVLVIEAGDWDTAPSVADPRLWFTNLGTERDWADVAVPSAGVNNRAIPEHMGKVVGGGSSINATIWVRPFKGDLEYWADASGDSDWGYEHALAIYRRVENWQGPPDARFHRARAGRYGASPHRILTPQPLRSSRPAGV